MQALSNTGVGTNLDPSFEPDAGLDARIRTEQGAMPDDGALVDLAAAGAARVLADDRLLVDDAMVVEPAVAPDTDTAVAALT